MSTPTPSTLPLDDTYFLILDIETVPDGELLNAVKYAGEGLSIEQAIARAMAEARELSRTGSDFVATTFHLPVAICVLRVNRKLELTKITCLDAPLYRSREMACQFWDGLERLSRARIVTFNGRGFDLPVLEFAAFRHGVPFVQYQQNRDRYRTTNVDLQEFFSNKGSVPMNGGLNLFAKMLGLPGKMDTDGSEVLRMHQAGQLQ
ncbi:MAG: ribonuclease H-like domain-containing protein, partial [Gemmataceae bacterium]